MVSEKMDVDNSEEKKNRMIVILPEILAGNMTLANRIVWLAEKDSRDIVYLALGEDDQHLLQVSRRVATMKAASGKSAIKTTSKIVQKNDWSDSLTKIYRSGDLVICTQELAVSTGFLKTKPISIYIQKELGIPVKLLAGFSSPWKEKSKQWLHTFYFWAGSIALLGIFTFLEIQIDLDFKGAIQTILFLLSLAIEFGLLLTWNHINES